MYVSWGFMYIVSESISMERVHSKEKDKKDNG